MVVAKCHGSDGSRHVAAGLWMIRCGWNRLDGAGGGLGRLGRLPGADSVEDGLLSPSEYYILTHTQ